MAQDTPGAHADLPGDRAVTVGGGTTGLPAGSAIRRVAGAYEPAAIDVDLPSPACRPFDLLRRGA